MTPEKISGGNSSQALTQYRVVDGGCRICGQGAEYQHGHLIGGHDNSASGVYADPETRTA